MKKRIAAHYGHTVLEKEWCDDCQMFAFVLDNEIQCCGKKVRDFVECNSYKHVRYSVGSGKRNHLSLSDKEAILISQKNKCIYCDADLQTEQVHFDHFIPFSFTYSGVKIGDMVAACAICNNFKNDKMFESIEEARMYLQPKTEKRRRIKDVAKFAYLLK